MGAIYLLPTLVINFVFSQWRGDWSSLYEEVSHANVSQCWNVEWFFPCFAGIYWNPSPWFFDGMTMTSQNWVYWWLPVSSWDQSFFQSIYWLERTLKLSVSVFACNESRATQEGGCLLTPLRGTVLCRLKFTFEILKTSVSWSFWPNTS